MHLSRRLKRMFIHVGHRDTGISEEAHRELAAATREVKLMNSMERDFRQLGERAREIRERNGFEEMMNKLLNQPTGRTRPHGSSGNSHST